MKKSVAINIILWQVEKGIFSHADWKGGAFYDNGRLALVNVPKQRRILERYLPDDGITVHETGESPKVKVAKANKSN